MPITEIGTIYTPSIYGRTAFPLQHVGDPIFYKIINSESSSVVDLSKDIINIPNHFFRTGEELDYSYTQFETAIGISTYSPGASPTTDKLPDKVYPIVIDKDNIRVALTTEYAFQNQYANLTSLGIGTQHSLEANKKNSKCLITINNIIQSPISVASTVKIVAHTQASLTLDSLENIKIGTCLKVEDEIVRVSAINFDEKKITLSRGPNLLGTTIKSFPTSINNTVIDVLAGTYNIVKDVIHFDEPPIEGKKISDKVPLDDVLFDGSYSFNYVTDILKTADRVLILWENPPVELGTQNFYYLIKNSENNFSFATSYSNALKKIKVEFSNVSPNEFPITDFRIVYFYPSEENTFTGRVFLRSNYSGNLVFDDISQQFTGLSSSFELKSSGISTVGIKSDNGILLVNNVFQYPGSDEAFSFVEDNTSTYVNFVGFGSTGFLGKEYDINVKGYPRGGIIVSYGTTSGTKYQPLSNYSNIPLSGSVAGVGASVSFDVDEYGSVRNLKFTNFGYNYKVGEILKPSGTNAGVGQVEDDKLHIKINEIAKDSFNAWNIGILDKLDDISSKVNGIRKTFSLTKNGQRVSLDADSQYEIELSQNLLIFINDVLQKPNSSYKFKNGSIITFTEPIPTGSNVKIYFYKGYYGDTVLNQNVSRLKIGDSIKLNQDFILPPPFEQNSRIAKDIISSDVLMTNLYSDIGLSESSSQIRSINWTPQKTDLIIDGEYVSKSRIEQNSGITTFSKIDSRIGTFTGISTNIIGITTTNLLVGDYLEDNSDKNYIGTGISIASISSGQISIASTEFSYSPAGVNTSYISIYRKY